jgi:heat shock protein HtpX
MLHKNTTKTFVLLAGLTGLLVVIGGAIGKGTGATIMLLVSLAMVGGSYWFSDKLAIKAARAVPASEAELPQYFAVMRELSQNAGMPMPKLYVTPDPQPNAFATGRNPNHAAVAVTRGILEICDWDELRGVLAHELSHVGNRDILIGSVAAAIATAITYLAFMARWAAIFGGGGRDRDQNPLALFATALLAPIAALLLQAALSRSREFEADRSGARLIGSGEPLARALQKLEHGARSIPMDVQPAQAQAYILNPLAGRRVQLANLFRTHPPTEERVSRLRGGEWLG